MIEKEPEPIKNIKAQLGRLVAGSYYDHQEVRITEFNRIRDIIRRKIEGIPTDKPEEKKEEEDKHQEKFKDSSIPIYLNQLVSSGEITQDEERYVLKVLEVQKNAEKYEAEYKNLMLEFVENEPIYKEFLQHIKGISGVLSANLIKELGYCEKAPHISSVWKYFGMHVINGKAPKREKGVKLDFDLKLRTLAWKIADSFVKQRTPFYRDIYDTEKEKQLNLMESQMVEETQNTLASHLINEDQKIIASHCNSENHASSASQVEQENQAIKASHLVKENHAKLASQEVRENHKLPASHNFLENHDDKVSHLINEDQNTIASHLTVENHGVIANHFQEENHSSLASQTLNETQYILASIPKTRMQCELRARRKMVKIFLAHYWMACKEITQPLELSKPFRLSEPLELSKPTRSSESNQIRKPSHISESNIGREPSNNSENNQPYAQAKLGHKHISDWKTAVMVNIAHTDRIKLERKEKAK